MTARLDRRTLLRGLGVTLALPCLDIMARPASAAGATASPTRMAFFYVPNGIHMPDWSPEAVGKLGKLPPILDLLSPYKDRMTVLSGLALDGARAHGDGGGDHARAGAAFLTGAHPKKTGGTDIHNGTSVDQLAASKVGSNTRLASLELGIERSSQSGACDTGYACAYQSNFSWRTPTTPVAKEIDPAAVFDRLVQGDGGKDSERPKTLREKYNKSVLDFVLEDAKDLNRRLGSRDQQKLDEYMYAVRDVERRIATAVKVGGKDAGFGDRTRPKGVPKEYSEHAKIMLDLVALALQTDTTRIITFSFANEGSNRSYEELGIGDGHHSVSHHAGNADKQAKIAKINRFHMTMFAELVKKLADTKEQGQSLLDSCMLVYGSGIGDGNRHNHDELPIVLLGEGNGTIAAGRHLRYPKGTPLTNLYVEMLDRMGAPVDSFSDSNGRLTDLAG